MSPKTTKLKEENDRLHLELHDLKAQVMILKYQKTTILDILKETIKKIESDNLN